MIIRAFTVFMAAMAAALVLTAATATNMPKLLVFALLTALLIAGSAAAYKREQ